MPTSVELLKVSIKKWFWGDANPRFSPRTFFPTVGSEKVLTGVLTLPGRD